MINKIFILESIPTGETQTGEELYNDTIFGYNQLYTSDIELYFKKIQNKVEFFTELDKILASCKLTDEIILHIEAHGNELEMGLKNNDRITWNELTDYLIPINKKLKNNLHLNVVTCFGRYAGLSIDLKKTSPYKSYISVSEKVNPREIMEDYTILYEHIVKTKNIYEGYLNLFKKNPNTKFYIKDVETVLNYHVVPNLNLFLKSGSLGIFKSFFDNYLNLNIDLDELNKIDNKAEFIFKKFIHRFTYN